MTYREFILMSRGYDRKRSLDFEHTRIICYTFLSAAPLKDPLPPMHKFWPLPTDEEEIAKEEEDLNDMYVRMTAKLAEHFPNKFKN